MNNILFFISNNLILSTIWFLLFSIIIFLIFKQFYLKEKLINNFYAIELINKKNAKIIDTRSFESYNSGHILNAIHIPLQNISFKKVKELNLPAIVPVILIIDSSKNNNKYVKFFIDNGIKNIYILKNGMDSWNIENLPVITNQNNNY
ncbi:rhodanese-like domain-containing protein [Buchnera aphidicola (Aphis craccivora)]|uniref:Rhodanese-like domain-containing protein n=1 Tax=Buchnera aphidicola (Aphis craccivora) TaxID=466616 RepID=A0A4D6XR44_9GAMM|nr:rhodanese-like domain-containing protein [Buchnera aphidicola]QCI16321.1 rhodanese-like domain-containing protein [Buchnera aphidicola (Aphis craccivora)]QLL40465.1 rhodanese-like domain-containing protein [Buchnera aphidicola (Aphis craccivore)]WAI17836.1 MAG: rhodanese-like domain-containing protein [Buchnera aphidicola (Aphis craccivora)]